MDIFIYVFTRRQCLHESVKKSHIHTILYRLRDVIRTNTRSSFRVHTMFVSMLGHVIRASITESMNFDTSS